MNANAIDWRALLDSAVSSNPKGKAGVAARLGVSRVYVSRVMSVGASAFKQPPAAFIERVIDRLFSVSECPVTFQPRPRSECLRVGGGSAPTHNPIAMHHWSKCQSCPHKPGKE